MAGLSFKYKLLSNYKPPTVSDRYRLRICGAPVSSISTNSNALFITLHTKFQSIYSSSRGQFVSIIPVLEFVIVLTTAWLLCGYTYLQR